MSAPLTKGQKAYLAQLARKAHARVFQGRNLLDVADLEDWRHEEVAKSCGKFGLRCASQADYKAVKGHFLALIGDTRGAMKAIVESQSEGLRVAQFKVIEACKEFGLRLAYADKICRGQNRGLGLDDVGERALWRLVFTIRNRGNAKKRKTINHK